MNWVTAGVGHRCFVISCMELSQKKILISAMCADSPCFNLITPCPMIKKYLLKKNNISGCSNHPLTMRQCSMSISPPAC